MDVYAKYPHGCANVIKIVLFGFMVSTLVACSLEANLQSLAEKSEILENLNRKEPDLIYGEVVTTSKGYQMTGVFGELSEKTTSLNGNNWQFEGVFYEQ